MLSFVAFMFSLVSIDIPQFKEILFLSLYKNIEIILIEGGSSDDSAIICDNYSEQDSRIKVFHKSNHFWFSIFILVWAEPVLFF